MIEGEASEKFARRIKHTLSNFFAKLTKEMEFFRGLFIALPLGRHSIADNRGNRAADNKPDNNAFNGAALLALGHFAAERIPEHGRSIASG